MLPEQFLVNSRLNVKALQKGRRNQAAQIAVAGLILTEQHQMPGLCVIFVDPVGAPASLRRYIDFTADDRLDSLGLGRLIKIHRAVHHSMIGNGNRGLSQLLNTLYQSWNTAGAVQEGKFRMNMQVDKGHIITSLVLLLPRAYDSIAPQFGQRLSPSVCGLAGGRLNVGERGSRSMDSTLPAHRGRLL